MWGGFTKSHDGGLRFPSNVFLVDRGAPAQTKCGISSRVKTTITTEKKKEKKRRRWRMKDGKWGTRTISISRSPSPRVGERVSWKMWWRAWWEFRVSPSLSLSLSVYVWCFSRSGRRLAWPVRFLTPHYVPPFGTEERNPVGGRSVGLLRRNVCCSCEGFLLFLFFFIHFRLSVTIR